jgi:hypothetical protein
MKPTFLCSAALAIAASVCAREASAAPTALTACQTINQPGSYVLANDLSITGECLVITTSLVTIDLAGFSITGNATGSGIRADQGVTNIVVRNGRIAGFASGINALSATGSIVEGVQAVGNTGIGIAAGGIVRGNIAERNGSFGIVAFGVVNGNFAAANTRTGILVGGGSTVTDNTTRDNSEGGLVVNEGSTVTRNTAAGNGGRGLSVSCPSNVIGNIATGNEEGNLVLDDGCTNVDNLAPPSIGRRAPSPAPPQL